MNHGFYLLTPKRQQLFLRGIEARYQRGESLRQSLLVEHASEQQRLEEKLGEREQSTTRQSADQQLNFLSRWDGDDEQTIAEYEIRTQETRTNKNRELSVARRDRKQAVAAEEQAYDALVAKIHTHYKTEKPKLFAQRKLETNRIDGFQAKSNEIIQSARELVMHRLGGPDKLAELVPAEKTYSWLDPANPPDLKKCFEELSLRVKLLAEARGELDKIPGLKFVESYYLLIVIVLVATVWCGAVYLLGASPLLLWMLGAIPLAGGAAVATLTWFTIPVRRQTKAIHPRIEKIRAEHEQITAYAEKLAVDKAAVQLEKLRAHRANELEKKRVEHEHKMLEIKQRAKTREAALIEQYDLQLANLEQNFQTTFVDLNQQMTALGQQKRHMLDTRLREVKHAAKTERSDLQAKQQQSIESLRERVRGAISRLLEHASQTRQRIDDQFPAWDKVREMVRNERGERNERGAGETLRWLPLGKLAVAASDVPLSEGDLPNLDGLALTLTRENQAGLIIDCPGGQIDAVAAWVRTMLWRALTAVAPGRVRLTLLDPVGRGQNFASLVGLGDLDPLLINHRVWSAGSQIASRLAELTQHVEDVLQTCLRDRYATIEDFNRDAGPLAEPYHIVAAIGLPTGLSRDAIDSLRALIDGGRRCGVMVILVRDTSQPWPTELQPLPESYTLRLRVDDQGMIWHREPGLEQRPISPIEGPPNDWVAELTERIGRGALAAQRVEIPLRDLIPANDYDAFDSAEGLSIPVGRQGVGRSLMIELGSGMKQHMLVAGKTGSGKSTLLHAMIMASVLRYSPDQLHLYLLDFKKGVEFKIYADQQLPHARVIGIESEREFGLSVLSRLDEELQRRGELFRDAGVQEMAEYRKRGKTLPRVLLVIDEFQELFTRDDRVAQECTMLLDRLVRQGRSFGIHVVLSSQSLAGAYTLPRATLGQMAVRMALQCSEADASLILSDDNTAARLLGRPGEAIFNDAGGLIEGNQPFQVAWLDNENHQQQLADIHDKHQTALERYGLPLIFEGNRPAAWSETLASAVLNDDHETSAITGLLGEAIRIGPPTTLKLSDQTGRNILCVADTTMTDAVLATWLPTAIANVRKNSGSAPRVVFFEGRRGDEHEFSLSTWLGQTGVIEEILLPRATLEKFVELEDELNQRLESPESRPPLMIVIHELERFRDLRQDENFGFSLDGSQTASGSATLQRLLTDGPTHGIHVVITCGSLETLTRWLPRTSHHDLELRIVGRVNANDSSQLIDTPEASNLAPASMYLYDDGDGRLEKFRLCRIAEAERVKAWLSSTL